MTNNINGIDASECRFYEPKAQKMTCHEEAITKPCESTPICYYKLLQKSYTEIQRLQEENKELKDRNANLRLNLATYDLPEIKKVLTDWRTGELDKKFKNLQKENEDLKTYIQKMDKPEIKTIDSEIALKNIELQQENEKIKKQYNCYACGNCNGKEDYIHLEIHHKGLRKQFDEYVKRNNTLSLRIKELEKENEQLKEYIKNLQVRKDRYYLQVLEFERQISDWVTFYMKISNIVSGNYEIVDSQGLQDLRRVISEVTK